MAQGFTSIKHLVEVALSTVTTPPKGVRGPLRGRDYTMFDVSAGRKFLGR